MDETKKGATGAATPNSAQSVDQMDRNHENSLSQKPVMSQQEKLFSLLPEGRSNAIPMQILAEQLGVDPRSLRAAIARAREAGEIIAGDSAGYYRPADKAELRRYYHTAKRRALSGLRALKAARRLLQEMEGQRRLGDGPEA